MIVPMPFVGHLGAPVFVPPIAHAFLWPALLGWAVFLVRQRRRRAWPCVGSFGVSLVPACLLTDGAALLAAIKYPDPQYNSLVLTLPWLAVPFSVTAYSP